MIPIGSKVQAVVALIGKGEQLFQVLPAWQVYTRYSAANSEGSVRDALQASRQFKDVQVRASKLGGAWQIDFTTIKPFADENAIRIVINAVLSAERWSIININVVVKQLGNGTYQQVVVNRNGVKGNVDDMNAAISNSIGNFEDAVKNAAIPAGISAALVIGAVLLVLVLRD